MAHFIFGSLTRIIDRLAITKPNYLLAKEILPIFIPQKWVNNSSNKNFCASLTYWYFCFSLRKTVNNAG
jgi:hypothetical protein